MPEKKPEKKPEKSQQEILTEQLKAAKHERSHVKAPFEAERKKLASDRKESLKDDLSKRMQATNALKKTADTKKAELKAAKDKAIQEAEEEYRIAEEELSITRAEAIDAAKFTCEESYGALNHQLQADSQPHIDEHKKAVKETEESYTFELEDIKKREKDAVELVDTKVQKLEEALQKLQKPPKSKKKRPPKKKGAATAEASA